MATRCPLPHSCTTRLGIDAVRQDLTASTGSTALGRPPRTPPAAKDGDGDSRIAPDPLSAVLPALSALGAISSIAAVNWVGQERTPERGRSRRKVGLVIRDLESCCLGLQEVFKRLNRNPRLFAWSQSPMIRSARI